MPLDHALWGQEQIHQRPLSGNFINCPYTLAMRHQQLQCYYNLNNEVISKELEVGPSDSISTDVLQNLGVEVSVADMPYR